MGHTFCVGDRVIVVVGDNMVNEGDRGTVVVVSSDIVHIGVRFDKPFGGHNCSGHCEYGYGRWMLQHMIELLGPEHDAVPRPVSDEELFAFLGI